MNINWYPGHMAKALRRMEESLKQVDAVVELLDARIPLSSRNPTLESLAPGKPRLIALNRADLADSAATKRWTSHYTELGFRVLILDCKSGAGCGKFPAAARALLADKIKSRDERGQSGRAVRLMVVGVPNVGKSSFINRIAGRVSAKVENRPGVTRGNQWVTAGQGVELLDTPGLLWPKLDNRQAALSLAFTGAIRDQTLDEETLARELLIVLKTMYPKALEAHYKLDFTIIDNSELLERLAVKRNYLSANSVPDIERAAPILLSEFRMGKLGRMTLEQPVTV